METTCWIRPGSQEHGGRIFSGRPMERERDFSLAIDSKDSQVFISRVSSSTGSLLMGKRWLSEPESSSISLTREDMRRLSCLMIFRNLPCPCPPWQHSTQERMTARGVRNSWEAAATNCTCFCWFSRIGLKSLPVKAQEKRDSTATAPRSINRKRIRWWKICSFRGLREERMITCSREEFFSMWITEL